MQNSQTLKACSSVDLFNYLQDQRHLVVLDVRPGYLFDQGFIRGSISVSQDSKNFVQQIEHIQKKAEEAEKKYKTQPIRRVVVIGESKEKVVEQNDMILELVASTKINPQKLFYLDGGYQTFALKYPFLVLSKTLFDKFHEMSQDKTLSEDQKTVLYASSRFPTVLIDDEILLGSNLNANSRQQLDDLKIKTLVDLNMYETPRQALEGYDYINIPLTSSVDTIIDFEEINEKIDSLKKPRLIYCSDGVNFTSNIAISYLMYKKKSRYDISTMKVFQMRGSTELDKRIYSQLMKYQPGVKIIRVGQQDQSHKQQEEDSN